MTSLVAMLAVGMVGATGCGFSVAPAGGQDARADGAADGVLSVDATVRPACTATTTTGLVACFELEDGVDDGTLLDSSPSHLDARTAGLVPASRGASHAASVQPGAVTYVPQATQLDRATGYTVAMWIRPRSMPGAGAVQGIYDHELQYASVLRGDPISGLQAHCIHTGVARTEWTEHLPLATWSFIACTWSGTELCALRWTSTGSHERYCHHPTNLPVDAGAHGLALGHLSSAGVAENPLDGDLDNLWMFDHALTADELCTELGQPAGCLPCNTCS